MKYKYYILENKNKNVQGVISDDNGVIVYEDLMVNPVRNEFSGSEEMQLVAYHESPVRTCDASKLVDYFETITITKDYWEAFYHAGGNKRKAVSESTEN
jgi:hypothetical protein